MNESIIPNLGETPTHLTVGHFWLLHRKHRPHLAGLEEGDETLKNAKLDFLSGCLSMTSFIKLGCETREEIVEEIISQAVAGIHDAGQDNDEVKVELRKLTESTGTNLAEMAVKLEELSQECKQEIVKLTINQN